VSAFLTCYNFNKLVELEEMTNKKIDLANFDFNQFKTEAINRLKTGESLTGKDGILTPLLKEILEAALDGEWMLIYPIAKIKVKPIVVMVSSKRQ
jgi:hypothetical protein